MTVSQAGGRGFTLMELLVVVLIIGILSTVALRTIDSVRDRSLFDQTAAEMEQLVRAITGDPTLVAEGRRTDFGFYGDFARLPNDLRELVENTEADPRWHGPYLRRTIGGDSVSYRYDAWGNLYGYSPSTGTINSLGNGKYPMTVRVADSLTLLSQNSVSGNILDSDGSPPGDRAGTMVVRLHLSSGGPALTSDVEPGGLYQFAGTVPVGTHRMTVVFGTSDSQVRWVSVAPRSSPVIDVRFSRPFRNQLVMVGQPHLLSDSAGFSFSVVNEGATPDTIGSVRLASIEPPPRSDSAFLKAYSFISDGVATVSETLAVPLPGSGGTVTMAAPYPVAANRAQTVMLHFSRFLKDDQGLLGEGKVHGLRFVLRFNDGSEIAVQVPDVPGP